MREEIVAKKAFKELKEVREFQVQDAQAVLVTRRAAKETPDNFPK